MVELTPARRPLFTHDELLPLIRPRSVAVVGASGGTEGFANQALLRMREADFAGPLYAVHPRFAAEAAPDGVHGLPSVDALPEPVDCVLVATPAATVLDVARAAAARGCAASIVFSAGFGETGRDDEAGAAAEAQLADLARTSGMRIGGPNTAGVLNYRDGLALTFVSDLRMDLPSGNLGIVAQSAGLATHLGHRRHRGAPISYTLTAGNSADVTAFDYANFLLDDDTTDVVLLAIEGIDDPAHLRHIGERSRSLAKPVLVMKTGRTRRGGHAAVSHTGSLAGSHDVFLTAAAEAGVQVFRHPEELLESGLLFARWAGRPCRTGGGVAVLTTMGGAGVIAADAADDHDVDLPDPSPRTCERLGELIPAFAATANPFDTTAFPSDSVLTDVLTALSEDEAYAAVVMLLATTTGAATARRPAAVTAAAERSNTPVAAVWLSSWLDGPGSEILDRATRVPVFRSSDTCFRALRSWVDWHTSLRSGRASATAISVGAGLAAAAAGLEASPPGLLDEARSRELMEACGIRVPRGYVAGSAEATAAAAAKVGWPVAVKILSAEIAHKAAVGGVELGVGDEAAAVAAYERVVTGVRAHQLGTRASEVLVTEMVSGRSGEFMCGLTRDPVFGPVIVAGAGGGVLEQTRDVARCTLPLTEEKAVAAIRRVRAHEALAAREPDTAAALERGLVTVMGTLAALATAAPKIAEVDLNPVVLAGDGDVVALDALVVLR